MVLTRLNACAFPSRKRFSHSSLEILGELIGDTTLGAPEFGSSVNVYDSPSLNINLNNTKLIREARSHLQYYVIADVLANIG